MTALAGGLIAEENARPGTAAWWPSTHAPAGALEAYTTQTSARPGDRIELCVSTRPPARYRLAVYRLGWYGGDGGRLVREEPASIGVAREAPAPDAGSGLTSVSWPVTESLYVAEDWTPGQYVAQLTLLGGPFAGTSSLVPFVVRRAPDDPPELLVQMPVNTTQAYNHWGGKSLYPSNSTDQAPAVKVSFDRPVLDWESANLNARAPFHYELPLIRFLEQEGFDVGYQTDVDTHREPWTLLTSGALVCAGHDEYWTMEMRNGFERARDARIHLAFLGANQCYWQARYEDAERTLVVYRSRSEDPDTEAALKTIRWRELERPRPESTLIGVRFDGGIAPTDQLLTYAVCEGAAEDSWGGALGDRSPLPGLVGYEWDGLDPEFDPPGLVRFLHCDHAQGPADCIRWRADSGAMIFAAGSLGITHGLDDWAGRGAADPRVRALVRAALVEMLAE